MLFKYLKKISDRFVLVLFMGALVMPASLWGMGEPPDFSDKKQPKLLKFLNSSGESDLPSPKEEPQAEVIVATNNEDVQVMLDSTTVLTSNMVLSEETKNLKRKTNKLIRLKQFEKAYVALKSVSPNQLSNEDKAVLKKLTLFHMIEKKVSENTSMFGKDDSQDVYTKRTTKRLYKGAQLAYVQEDPELTEDLLIQTLFLNRRHFGAKQLMEYGLNKPVGMYKVENLESKYWKTSLVSLYSGYPDRAVKELKVLEYFDPENPLVFERMGSAYYSMGKTKEAIQAWKRALYLDPNNKTLSNFIKNAEVEEKRQEKALKAILSNKKKDDAVEVDDTVEMQTLGVYVNSNQAYSFAQEVRSQLNTENVVVEELPNGKWAVKVPKKQPKKEK